MLSRKVLSYYSFLSTAIYDPKAFIPHAASLRQTFVHCAIFLVAAIRRCMNRVAVSLWGITLSRPLAVIALVSHYLTNKLIAGRLIPRRAVTPFPTFMLLNVAHTVLAHLSMGYSLPRGRFLPVTHPSAMLDHKWSAFDLHA